MHCRRFATRCGPRRWPMDRGRGAFNQKIQLIAQSARRGDPFIEAFVDLGADVAQAADVVSRALGRVVETVDQLEEFFLALTKKN
jgi:ABC-type transporter Mla subunit MlaD